MAGRKSQLLQAASRQQKLVRRQESTTEAARAREQTVAVQQRLLPTSQTVSPAQLLCRSADEIAANWSSIARNVQTATLFQRPPSWCRQPPLQLSEIDLIGTTENLSAFVASLLCCAGHRGELPSVPHINSIQASRVMGSHVKRECPAVLHMLTDTAWPNASSNIFAATARASGRDQRLWEAVSTSSLSSPVQS